MKEERPEELKLKEGRLEERKMKKLHGKVINQRVRKDRYADSSLKKRKIEGERGREGAWKKRRRKKRRCRKGNAWNKGETGEREEGEWEIQ